MKKANRSTGRRRQRFAKREISGYRAAVLQIKLRWLAVICATLVCLGLFAARNGAQQVDSGWAVAIPSPLASGATNSPEQELVIRHVLEQTRQPLLRKPESGQANAPKKENTEGGLRFAARPESSTVDGWRAAGPSLGPAHNSTAQNATPQSAAANASSKRTFEVECDCSGISVTERKADAARLPSPEPGLPQLQNPAGIEESPATNASIEEASKDDAPAP